MVNLFNVKGRRRAPLTARTRKSTIMNKRSIENLDRAQTLTTVERGNSLRHPGLRRNKSGNVLILVTVAMTVLGVGVLIAGSFAGVFFTQERLQSEADSISLAGARKLNEFNRLGQMNDMIARSRQLVFDSDKDAREVESYKSDSAFEKLTRQLDEEAKGSAELIEQERHKLALLAKSEAKEAMKEKFDQVKNTYSITLPWLTIQTPDLILNETGSVKDMQSNAQEIQGFPELTSADRSNVLPGSPVNLYRAENDARLPIASSPSFRFSPLPAPVSNDMAPARSVLPESFKQMTGDFAPCAAQVALRLNVGTGLGANAKGSLEIRSAALATGGGLWQ